MYMMGVVSMCIVRSGREKEGRRKWKEREGMRSKKG